MIHIPIALAVQLLLCLFGFDFWQAGLAAVLMFFMREVTQAEYRWIEKNGGLRAAMPWWMGLDVKQWDRKSRTDVVYPAIAVFAVALLASPLSASAQTIGIHGPSTHFREGPNNYNAGLYVRSESNWELGAYYNSRRNLTVYAGRLFETRDFYIGSVPIRPAVFVGLATGYGHPVIPAALIGASWPIAQEWRGRLAYTKNPQDKTRGVLHFSVERRF